LKIITCSKVKQWKGALHVIKDNSARLKATHGTSVLTERSQLIYLIVGGDLRNI